MLLIGKRARILQEAARILNSHDIDTEITDNLDLSHLKAMDIKDVSCVAFGRALTKDQKKELTNHYLQPNPQIKIIEGWARYPSSLPDKYWLPFSHWPAFMPTAQIYRRHNLSVYQRQPIA